MSTAPSGRYQSRLFNFFSRQSRELVDKCDRALRHAKVATVWGAQILLYPLYAMFQATRLVGRQIQTTIETGQPSLNAAHGTTSDTNAEPLSKADQIVHNVLQAVETLALPEVVAVPALAASGSLAIAEQSEVTAPSNPSLISRFIKTAVAGQPSTGKVAGGEPSAIAVQGVATALETRTLVLVTLQNQILDILTPEQQRQLYQRIVWEVSHYQRYLHILARQRSHAPLHLPSDNPKVLPPIRLVRQIMAWVQTGPVAIALDWFQESTVVARLSSNSVTNSAVNSEEPYFTSHSTLAAGILPIPPIPYEALAPLDRAIAQIEARSLPPILTELPTALVQRGQGLISTLRAKLSSQPTLNGSTPLLEIDSQPQLAPMPLQALLRAAVDYFFGDRRPGLPGKADQSQPVQVFGEYPGSDRLLTGDYDWHPDPWLSYEDVFGQGSATGDRAPDSIQALPAQTVTPPIALPPALQVPLSTAKNWWTRLVGRFWQRDTAANASLIVSHPASTADLTPLQSQPTAIASPRNLSAKATRTTSLGSPRSRATVSGAIDPLVATNLAMSGAELAARSEDYGDISNTWIEAEATTLGYVKHPLERILGWLDRAMLWLEEIIILVGQWLQGLWGK